MSQSAGRLIAHIVFRFDYGGLENGVANIVNALNSDAERHVIIAMTEATSFRERLHAGIEVHELHKRPGKDFGAYIRLFKLLRQLRPDIVHSRNVGTMDCALIAWLAGVRVRIHGEHGWDVADPDGTRRKFRWFRRLLNPFVTRYISVSRHIKAWLVATVGIQERKIEAICNGVDIDRFRAASSAVPIPADAPAWLRDADTVVVGSVCRFQAIKDPLNLVDAFIQVATDESGSRARLVMVGDGALHAEALARIDAAGLAERCWLPGSRDDVDLILAQLDVFVLGSLREGISNTILEAMACGLPIVATDTGGNGELVDPAKNGALVPPADRAALAEAISIYVLDPSLRSTHGAASRQMAETTFSLTSMIDQYRAVYAQQVALIG